ncbi:MAG: hypothetical protein M9947_01335 [Thermomicrobiales bacterium]|nr:hypothetical protein [Thermomicrobiales bacterium]
MREIDFEVAPRFVFLGDSIVSDWRNPQATTSRAVVQALGDLGFETVYMEPRRNSATVGLLGQRGSEPVRSFNALWTGVQYRTVDLPARWELEAWIGQFAATSGVIVLLDGMPEMFERGLAEFEQDDVLILVERPELGGDWGRSVLRRLGESDATIGFRPAVLPGSWDVPRSGTVLVAYDDADLARAVAATVPDARRIVTGSADLPDWDYLPEIELPAVYGAAERVLVVDSAERPIAPARVWLPRANGAAAWGMVQAGEIDESVAVRFDDLENVWDREAPDLPERLDARWVARGLVEMWRHRSIGSEG